MAGTCKANKTFTVANDTTMAKSTKSINHSCWEGCSNDKKFIDALADFMNQSWSIVCQIRERSGLNASYEMSSTEIQKRIQDVCKKLDEKYKEVEHLESQKAQLQQKSPLSKGSGSLSRSIPSGFQPVASSTPANQTGYSGNYSISYYGTEGSSSYWPTSSGSGGTSPSRRMQVSGSTTGSSCPPSCPEYSQNSSGGYKNYSEADYGY